MSLCETVSILANELEQQLDDLSESHKNMLSVMKKMPKYLKQGNLASWEADYKTAISELEDEQSINYKAIDLLYEIAGLNLFGAFQVEETINIYSHAVNELKKMNIIITNNLNVQKW